MAMPDASGFPNWLGETVEDDFLHTLASLKSEEAIRQFLEMTLTPRELYLFGCRFRAIVLLCHGYTPGQVREMNSDHPNISRGVISRANALVRGKARHVCMAFYGQLKQDRDRAD